MTSKTQEEFDEPGELGRGILLGMNPFRRFLSRFRKPDMVGRPPSARSMWSDPAGHAVDFSYRFAEPMDYHVEQRMTELGIPTDRIGSSDVDFGIRHAAFHPHGTIGGSNGAGGRLTVDSGVFHMDLMVGQPAEKVWPKARLRDRLDAIITHEYEEAKDGSHVAALTRGPDTELPIREEARKLLRKMRGDTMER